MKRFSLLLLFSLLAFTVAACGGASVAEGGAVAPGPDAPRINSDIYLNTIAGSEHVLVDVRTPGEVASSGVISGAVHIPLNELSSRVSELPADTTVVVYCNSGNRSRQAVSILNNNGYDQLLDLQGIQQWLRDGQPLVPLGQ
jgi:rhodanese-related sulfurtransferase